MVQFNEQLRGLICESTTFGSQTQKKKKKHDLPLITTSNITKNEMTYSKNTQKTMYKQSNTHAVLDGTLVTK